MKAFLAAPIWQAVELPAITPEILTSPQDLRLATDKGDLLVRWFSPPQYPSGKFNEEWADLVRLYFISVRQVTTGYVVIRNYFPGDEIPVYQFRTGSRDLKKDEDTSFRLYTQEEARK